jgi:DNA invertase Pin-like site-specific DNA recombinase
MLQERVSKSDGSQDLNWQRDALVDTAVDPERIHKDLASGRKDDRPGLRASLKALQPGNTLVVTVSHSITIMRYP